MKKIKLVSVLLLCGLVALSGCDSKKTARSNAARVARGGTNSNYLQGGYNQGGNTGPYNQGGTYQGGQYTGTSTSQWAYIQSNDPNNFYQSVQGLISASMNPQELGHVNSSGDVAIIGYIDMDQAGNVNRNNTRLRIEIWDEYARSGSASEIALAFNSLANYSYNGNQISLIFQDNYGQVVVTGQINQNLFSGSVSYQNSASFDGGSNPAAGVLGNFQVSACGFFRCQ